MWWHFINEFYNTTQSSTENTHSYSGAPYYKKDSLSPQQGAAQNISSEQEENPTALPVVSSSMHAEHFTSDAPSLPPSPNGPQQQLEKEGRSAFALWDETLGFYNFSENFQTVTGLPGTRMQGEQWIMALEPENQYQVHRMLSVAAEEALPSQILVETISFEGLAPRQLIMNITPASEQDGRVMAFFYDVTVQKQLEEALTKAEISLKKANRSRSAFLSCLSHELRTPLNAIMGFSQMMQEQVLGDLGNPRYGEYAQHIHHSGAELLRKISNLLDVAALDSGGMAPDFTACGLREILEELRDMYAHKAFQKRITISLSIAEECQLYADKRMIIGAISHLITNAIAHAREDSTLHISAKQQKNEGLIISVRDKGAGIAPSKLSAICDALREEATYFNMHEEGIGLGLSMAKEFIARHGGTLRIDSMLNHGTIAYCQLPEECIRPTLSLVVAASN